MASALQFDGSQNYLTLGTMGSLGSNLASGFYLKFTIKTTSTAIGALGFDNSSNPQAQIAFNLNSTNTNTSGTLRMQFADSSANRLRGAINSPTVNFNDGAIHTIIVTANFTAKTITVTIDGVTQTTTYTFQNALTNFVNFPSFFGIGAQSTTGSPNTYFSCTIDSIFIGTSSGSLYGSYALDEGTGSTTADGTGNGNTGTLTGSPLPTWVNDLSTTTSTTTSTTSTSTTTTSTSSSTTTTSTSTSTTISTSTTTTSTSSSTTTSTSSSTTTTSTSTTTTHSTSTTTTSTSTSSTTSTSSSSSTSTTTTSTSTSSTTSTSSSTSTSTSTTTTFGFPISVDNLNTPDESQFSVQESQIN